MIKIARLNDRSLLSVTGDDATDFLQNLITCDVENLQTGEASFGGLLSPQGKILFDFIVQKQADGFLFDVASKLVDDLAKRLTFYKLRANVTVESSPDIHVYSVLGDQADLGFADPRLPALGRRHYTAPDAHNTSADEWHAQRINCGVPELGSDFESGEVFPHEALMDQFGDAGVDFQKGCYVGQEVVSRMQHRGTTRRRFVKIEGAGTLPDPGCELTAGDRVIGTLGSHFGTSGLALVRLDRAKQAMDDAVEIKAGDVSLTLALAGFVSFGWPE